MAKRTTAAKASGEANLGFEATRRSAADKLRGHMDAAEYKHVVLGLIFLKYISEAFEEQRARLKAEEGADREDRDEYLATQEEIDEYSHSLLLTLESSMTHSQDTYLLHRCSGHLAYGSSFDSFTAALCSET